MQSWTNGVTALGGSSSSSSSAAIASPSTEQGGTTLAANTINSDPAAPQSVVSPTGQPDSLATSLLRASMLRTGNQLPLHLLPPGTTVHCISLRPGGKASICRSAGSFGKIVASTSSGSKGQIYAQVQLQSGEVRKLNKDCTAVIGSVSNREHQNKVLGKAGRSRWLGRKPRVRGVAMNAYVSLTLFSLFEPVQY